jgi:hypothetical protein
LFAFAMKQSLVLQGGVVSAGCVLQATSSNKIPSMINILVFKFSRLS